MNTAGPSDQPDAGPSSTAVVVRTFNSRATLEECLDSIEAQTVQPQVVVVDSGSTDGTLELARARSDELVQLAPGTYTPGRALNAGFAAADADLVMPLSSHCAYQDPHHVERVVAHHRDPQVAATLGASGDPTGARLTEPLVVDRWPVGRRPWWGFSNHSSSIRRDVWAEVPFEETLLACEDKEWAARTHARGLSIVYDPAFVVPAKHRRNRGLRAAYRRGLAEGHAFSAILPGPPPSAASVMAERFTRQYPGRYPDVLLWFYPPRVAESLGMALGMAGRARPAAG